MDWALAPVFVKALRNSVVVKVSAGLLHSTALSSRRQVYIWGDNSQMQHFLPGPLAEISKPSSLYIFQGQGETDIVDIACMPYRTCVLGKTCAVLSEARGSFYKLHWSKLATMVKLVCSDSCVGVVSALNQLYTLDLSTLAPQKEHYRLELRLDGLLSTTSSNEAIGVTDCLGRAFRVYPDVLRRETTIPKASKVAFSSKHNLALMPVVGCVVPPEPSFDSLTSISEARAHCLIVKPKQNFWTAPELVEFADMYNTDSLRRSCEHFLAQNLVCYS